MTADATSRAIVLTVPGAAAIAVVRLVGPGVSEFLRAHFSKPVPPGRCVHGLLRDGERELDDPVVVMSGAGTHADINLHGGPWVVRSVLQLARRDGFEVCSSATEISGDAVDADDPIAREVLTHLHLARTELAIRVLLAQERAWKDWRPTKEEAARTAVNQSLWWLLHPPRVAILGATNVGKSTLANQLFAQERSITADLPGTTRDWVGEIANIDGLAVILVDTPGVRDTDDAIERAAIEQSRGQIERADLIVLVLDATRPLNPEQRPLIDAYPRALRVVNKSDRAAVWDADTVGGIATVATTGAGVDALRRAIAAYFGCADIEINLPHWWTERQRQLLLSR